ncbi:hypothetical protein FOIG_03987 [Fusarium odoratissimum NRRL 54006]|uniref:Methyltransferase n=1 Tax=Fusarium odoratissimum (strain NRRL 54006) TaxID=1089451 RepID=X0K9J9_FUSO5|nr:uncharacterized protein FOIG_03987 [Fusarium odoratissimum NRRL 54006]EXM05392.1 hypothetical protein FOIG_03987 [Fusarium odoratissimum NRRL 54006]
MSCDLFDPLYAADSDVNDTAFEDDAESSTASISSSILECRKFQGRTFHSERYNTEYFTPNDEQQRDSIDITHHVLTLLLDGNLTLVPLKDSIRRVLDVGTGTVIWAIDFADEHPNVEVIGTDLSPIQPSWVPPNVKFELEDATKDWSWPENHLDLVHVRFLIGAIADWGTLFKEASHCCKPGGFVESGEINPTFYSDDGTIDDAEALQTWNRLVIESGKGFGRSFTDIENDVQLFRDAGLVDLQSFDFKVPIGGWPKDEYQVCFPCHPFKVQVYIGIYSWLGLLLDDQAAEYLEEFSMFHERFCADEKQPIPLLQGWADLMRLTFRYWGPLVANFTVTSSLNFLNLMLLRPERSSTRSSAPRPAEAGHGFFEKDGGGETCAWFTFPKELCPDISLFLEVVPDISMCIGLTNDALSFYKEEKAGETHNYIHNRAWYENKDPQSSSRRS